VLIVGCNPPSIRKYKQDGILVWRLFGDWVRNLPTDTREAAMAELEEEVQSIVVDISGVRHMDNWGVCLVGDVLEEANPKAAWVVRPLQVRISEDLDFDLELRGIHLHRYQNLQAAVQKVKALTR
jgi:anti-anti-sigma regulatory factor